MKKLIATCSGMVERVAGLIRRPRAYFAVVIPIALPLLVAAVNLDPPAAAPQRYAAASIVGPSLRYDDLATLSPALLPQHSVVLTVENGDTLATILQSAGFPAGESAQLTHQFAGLVDLRRLRPGDLVRFHYDALDRIDSVTLKVTGWGDVRAVRGEDGKFEVTSQPAEIREVEVNIAATVDTSLYEALRASGESPQLVQPLVDVFQWDIDFFELQRGDSFSLVVKKRFAGNDVIGYGPIAAARFTHRGTTYEAFRHETPDGRAGYYARTGSPLRKQFLRAPLRFPRVTSGFTKKRFHPVLHLFRPHHGVDYGAPVGTPVMTTADGVVVEAAYKRGEGNYVRIKHSSRIETWYLHLSKFAKGLQKGTKVTQGDVIGYVGATGLATGPHLDYRVRDDGTWLDPLKLKSITPDPLRGNSLAQFRSDVARLLPRLGAPGEKLAHNGAHRRALF